MSIIKLNDRGIEVRKLQLLLNSLMVPRPNLKIDGYFGQHTQQAVLSFQQANGLTPDGPAILIMTTTYPIPGFGGRAIRLFGV